MADKKFGVKQINLIGASGTPTLTSPNNLNINATTVAISTDVTVGGELTGNIIGNVKSASLSGLSTFSNLQIGLSTVYSVSDFVGNVAIGTNTTVNEYNIGKSTLVLDGRTWPENPNVVGGGSLQINSNAKKFGEIGTLDGVGIGSFFNIDAYVPLSVNNYGTNNYAYVGIAATFGSDVTVGVDTSVGVVLTSPNGTQYRLVVDNSGNLTTTLA
jgi:phage gp45-like